MALKDFFKPNTDRLILGSLLAFFVFFYFDIFGFLRETIFNLTGKSYIYAINLDQVLQGLEEPIMQYNWLLLIFIILFSILISLIIGYLISVVFFAILKNEKSFFAFTRTKLYITIGLLILSFAIGFITIEMNQSWLRPILSFLSIGKTIDFQIGVYLGNTIMSLLILPMGVIHMYFYSCLIEYIRKRFKK